MPVPVLRKKCRYGEGLTLILMNQILVKQAFVLGSN